jgi:4a-hydroxytetrahydrobiopterin dehydratase
MKQALTPAELDEALKDNPAWTLKDGKLTREWTFQDFIQAMTFVNRIAELAESSNHHPDIDIRYNCVLLGLISHDAGGITQRDVRMAARIDRSSL